MTPADINTRSFAGDNGKQITQLEINRLHAHPCDPFQPYTAGKLRELAESIETHGLLEPIVVRPHSQVSEYEILAGKNRVSAAKLNGAIFIDAIVQEANDEEALLIVTDSNLKHRDRLLPSERGFAYKLQLEALKKQGKRSDLAEDGTFSHNENKLNSTERVAAHNKLSRSEMHRFIRLTYLIPEFLQMVDKSSMPILVGVDLSYFNKTAQQAIYQYFYIDRVSSIDLQKSGTLRMALKENGAFPITPALLDRITRPKRRKKPSNPVVHIGWRKLKDLKGKLPEGKVLEEAILGFLRERYGG
jgi:ParB family chromosome partitioning protein